MIMETTELKIRYGIVNKTVPKGGAGRDLSVAALSVGKKDSPVNHEKEGAVCCTETGKFLIMDEQEKNKRRII